MSYQEEVKRVMDLSFKAGAVFGFLCGVSIACSVVLIAMRLVQ